MNFSRKMVMALMPLLMVIGLQSAGQFNINTTGGGSGATFSGSAISGGTGNTRRYSNVAPITWVTSTTTEDPSTVVLQTLPGGAQQYLDGSIRFPAGTQISEAEGFAGGFKVEVHKNFLKGDSQSR